MIAVIFRPLGTQAISVISMRPASLAERRLAHDQGASSYFVPGQGYSKEDWDAVSDNPEWTEEDFRNARPFAEVFPELVRSMRNEERRRGLPRTKEAISIRLDIDLAQKLRASGPGWQSRVNQALREWLEKTQQRPRNATKNRASTHCSVFSSHSRSA